MAMPIEVATVPMIMTLRRLRRNSRRSVSRSCVRPSYRLRRKRDEPKRRISFAVSRSVSSSMMYIRSRLCGVMAYSNV
jgi:hypothetical protein